MMDRPTAPELGGERKDITILFTDIAGFTPIAEGLEPELVMQRMSTYFEILTAALRAHGGTIDKFIGDAVMAFWNGLVHDPNHVASGCRAVLAAHAAIGDLNNRLLADGLAPMPTRFGLHTGPAVVGNVGSSERMNFTALGATVNLAARLEPLNKVYGTEILVSEQIARQVGHDFLFRSVALVRPKGVTQPLRVYELLADGSDAQNYAWVGAWETAFTAFVSGDLGTAMRGLEALGEPLADDPVRLRLLARTTKGAKTQTDWSAVDAF
jgi:adenylate cyclase